MDRQTERETQRWRAIGNDPPLGSSNPQPRVPPPEPQLKPGPVFVASGGVIRL